MRTLLFAAGAVLLSGVSPAQTEPLRSPTQAWTEFLALRGDDWHAVWNKATETPSAVYGPGLFIEAGPTRDLADARRRADRVLLQHRELLGATSSDFVETIGQQVRRLYIFVYDQQFRGLDVISGRADVRVHADGGISMFGSRAVQIARGFDTAPKIGADYAQAIAYTHVDAEPGQNVGAPELVIWADTESKARTVPVLAWQVQVDARPRAVYGKVYVDAKTGRVVEWSSEIYECAFGHTHVRGESAHRDGETPAMGERLALGAALRRPAPEARMGAVSGTVMGWMILGDDGRTASTNQPIPNVRVVLDNFGGQAFTDASGNFTINTNLSGMVTARVDLGAGDSRHAAGGVFTFNGFGDPFCQPPCNNNPPVVASQAVSANATATVGGAPITLQLAPQRQEFQVSQVTSYWHTNDVNEWIRSVLGNSSQLNTLSNMRVYNNWGTSCNAFYGGNGINFFRAGSGCVNSAFSGIVYHEWGHGLDDQYGGVARTEGLSEGWGDIIANFRTDNPLVGQGFSGGAIRTALNTRTYPPSPTAGVHTQGQSWMGFAWDARTRLRSSLGANAGASIADTIIVGSIVADATNQPNAVREVFLLDDDDSNLNNGVPHYSELSAAARARNLPFPEVQLGSVTHITLGNTTKQLSPRLVTAIVVPATGSFTGVDLVFDAGSGTVRRPMVRAGSTNWRGMLPGVLSPQAVSYHFEARHSTNATLRQPEAGAFRYAVGQETQLFSDDMESGAGSWTSQQVARQNDWQFGRPAGRSVDPNGAFSGTNARGNDLGIGNFNGAYQNNVDNFLRTPLIDARGVSGVTLEYRRWLTVESAQYDQARIRVGGQTAWSNPQTVDLIDTAWSLETVPLPQLDNTQGQVEWRLTTDGGLTFGGWTIDDVRVFSFTALPPPAVQFTATPAQVPSTGSTTLAIDGTPGAIGAILLAMTPGPTPVLPGLTLEVGANFLALPVQLDAAGDTRLVAPGSANPALVGQLLYLQALEIANGSVTASNGVTLLFGQ